MERTGVGVVTSRGVWAEKTTGLWRAAVVCAGVRVIADQGVGRCTAALYAIITQGAEVTVVTREIVAYMLAADQRITAIVRAGVFVITVREPQGGALTE